MKLCNTCVTPETAESIGFDSNNQCTVCKQIKYKKNNIDWKQRDLLFDTLISKYKGKSKYDCIVPFSGGKDSSFTLWYLVKEKKLNPLVVRYDHNFLRKTVQKNTKKIIDNLKVDFIELNTDQEIIKKTMIESLLRRGDFCWHCHVGVAAFPINTAIKKGIPLLIYGEPSSEYGSFYSYEDFEVLDVDYFNKIFSLGLNAEDMIGMINERFKDNKLDKNSLNDLKFPSRKTLSRNKIHAAYLGDYLQWDTKKFANIIKTELDWQGEEVEGIPSEYDYEKIECLFQGVRDYLKFLKRGFGRTSHLTSIDVREGKISREEALKLCKKFDGKRPASLDYFLDYLNLSEDQFYEIAFKHVVPPHKNKNIEDLKKNRSKQIPEDLHEVYKELTKK